MAEDIAGQVFRQVQRCLTSLVGGSGHLASYSMLRETFHIAQVDDLEEGLRRYHFSAEAYRESEFAVYGDDSRPETEPVSGSIVLDGAFNVVRDEDGRIAVEPWASVDPLESDAGRET